MDAVEDACKLVQCDRKACLSGALFACSEVFLTHSLMTCCNVFNMSDRRNWGFVPKSVRECALGATDWTAVLTGLNIYVGATWLHDYSFGALSAISFVFKYREGCWCVALYMPAKGHGCEAS